MKRTAMLVSAMLVVAVAAPAAGAGGGENTRYWAGATGVFLEVHCAHKVLLYNNTSVPYGSMQQLEGFAATVGYKGAYPNCNQSLARPSGYYSASVVFAMRMNSTGEWVTLGVGGEYTNYVGASSADTGVDSAMVPCGPDYAVIGGHKAFLVGALRQSLTVASYSSCVI